MAKSSLSCCCDSLSTDPDDYESVVSVALVFFEAEPVGAERCTDVMITDDSDVVEPDQSFYVSLATSDPVYIIPTPQAPVIIVDNDCESTI